MASVPIQRDISDNGTKDDIPTPAKKVRIHETPTSTPAEEYTGDQNSEPQSKRKTVRKRKKKVFTMLQKQMEFYFSDANIAKSAFMQEILKDGGWIKLSRFMNFNKLISILESGFGRVDIEDLYTALTILPSELIEVREFEGTKEIRRIKAVATRSKETEEGCTIYVENLPQSATIESITELFDKFGKVIYVSLPKFKTTQLIKGFSFVEFESPESVSKVLKAMAADKNRLQPKLDPAELQSVKAYIQEQNSEKEQQRKQTKAETVESDGGNKEKKKSRNKKNRQKIENLAEPMQFVEDTKPLELGGLQILSKKDWKKLRNTYLDLQRKNMKEAKQKIRHFTARDHRPMEPADRADVHADVKDGLAFEPNVVVRFEVDEPICDVDVLKKKIKAAVMEPVKYIDSRPGCTTFYVRCANSEQAKRLSNVKLLGEGKVLTDSEEKSYWDKAQKDRLDKIGKKVDVKKLKPRGKDRVIQKFKVMQEKQINVHKYFDEDE